MLACGAGPARADEAAARSAEALALFEKSSTAYDRGHFGEAIDLLVRSYALKPEPVLLYNMGRAYEGLGDLAKATAAYEQFLAAQPDTPDRGALERRIATMRRQLAERDALQKQALEHPVRSPRALPWVVTGIGAAGLLTGGTLGLLASQTNDDAKAEPTHALAAELQSDAKSMATVANVCFVAGAVVLVTGVVWGIVDASAAGRVRTVRLGTFAF